MQIIPCCSRIVGCLSRLLAAVAAALFLGFGPTGHAQSLAIDSLSGPITQNEINSFKTYMAAQCPPPNGWTLCGGTLTHNTWADGNGGNELEAMALMYEATGDSAILTNLISWTDYCVSQRNDLMSAALGGQRVMWTNGIAKVWCPEPPTNTYAGGENGDTKAHILHTALIILQNPSLWNQIVPDGNPYAYGATYFQRATNYLGKCDEANDNYDQIFITSANTIRDPTNWPAGFHTMEAVNIQAMMLGDFQLSAQCHEILGDAPSRLAYYDTVVKTASAECINGMANCHPTTTNGDPVYAWGYYPWSVYPANIESVGHAAYDMIGVWRAYTRASYNFPLSLVRPFGNALVDVMTLGPNTFSGSVNGTGTTQNYMQQQWLLLADMRASVYDVVAAADVASGRYKTTPYMTATILWMKNRRHLQFSISPSPGSRTVQAGSGTSYALAVAPLGASTNNVTLSVSGLPTGANASFSASSINLGSVAYVSTNSTLSVTTTGATPPGTYPLLITGVSGSVTNTATVSLTVGNFSIGVSPPAQSVPFGSSNITYTVTITTNTGFSGSISFGISGLPAAATAGFNPASLSGAGTSTLTVNAAASPAGGYTLTLYATNGATVASTTAGLTLTIPSLLVWNGGSAADNNWSDATNWGGFAPASGVSLQFAGGNRLTPVNDTAAGTTYSNIAFNAGAGAFQLTGNPITLVGSITNNSANPQTVDLGLSFATSFALNGAGNTLVIGNGLTNTTSAGVTTLTLSGSGILTNLLKSSGGTNIIALADPSANWTIADNPASASTSGAYIISVNNGTLNFGAPGSAPTLSTTPPNGNPQDNQVGALSGAVATFNMVNGTLTTVSRFNTATTANSTGILNQSGGTFNMGSQFQGANGGNSGEVSQVNLTGGTMNIGGGGGPFYVASRGTGTLTISGSAVLNCGTLDLSRNANGNTIGTVGTVNLSGGVILASKVGTATANSQTGLHGPSATFNFDGGTLRLNSSTAPFFQGGTVAPIIPITAVVKAGGAVIDTNGKTNVFAEPLLHDASLDPDPDGGLTKNGAGSLILASDVTYNGNTTINAGSLILSNSVSLASSPLVTIVSGAALDATGRGDQTLALAAGQTLSGSGSIVGILQSPFGSFIAPGSVASIGALMVSGNATLNGTTFMKLNKTALACDTLQVGGSLNCGGTLQLTNISGVLAPGDSFKLFTGSAPAGSFTNVVPAMPGSGLAWDFTSLASSGTIKIITAPPPHIGHISPAPGQLSFTGFGGQPRANYYVLWTTNMSLPPAQWSVIATNAFDNSGNFQFSLPRDPNSPRGFYILQLP